MSIRLVAPVAARQGRGLRQGRVLCAVQQGLSIRTFGDMMGVRALASYASRYTVAVTPPERVEVSRG
jgi:hypothetical protein